MSKQHADLSFDAMFLGCCMFSMMTPGEGTLTFKMKESRPTARTQAALDELVAKGKVKVGPFNQLGGLVYTPLVEFPRATAKQMKQAGEWPYTERISAPD